MTPGKPGREGIKVMLSEGYLKLLPVYPLIAQQILDDYQVDEGICIDIGTGPGYMGLELAKITNLEVYFLDMDPASLDKAKRNVAECELDNAVHFVEADVTDLPFGDNFADFIVSRGSLWFWKDQVKGLQEIHRVLKEGGIAFVGGGLGRYTPATMRERLKGRRRIIQEKHKDVKFLDEDGLRELISETGLAGCRIVSDGEEGAGTWIEMRK
jgi:ubiquinone/menaquinone biosynthesis C-methylase UbiE